MSTPLSERITRVDKLRSWSDRIPLHYEYTAGVAGERFLRGLQRGRILAAKCGNCGKMYLPPKMYCVDCYLEIRSYRSVGPAATVAALAGDPAKRASRTFAFLTFDGVAGGLVHYARGKELEIGSRVVPRFKPARKSKGTLLDIEGFVTTKVRA